MTHWFGESWGAPCCESDSHVDTPVGVPCIECDTPIDAEDQGFMLPYANRRNPRGRGELAYHRVCFLRTVIPCGMWTEEMIRDMPPRWVEHRAEHHPRLHAK